MKTIKFLVLASLGVAFNAVAAPAVWESDFGAPLSLTDDSVANLTFGDYDFSFPFNGTTYSGTDTLSVSSNGFVSFGGDNGNDCCAGSVTQLLGDTYGRIAVFWADLYPGAYGDVYINAFNDDADPQNDRLVITWDTALYDNDLPILVQVQLFDDGSFIMGYNGFTLAGFNDDTLIGTSPGGGASDPGSTNLIASSPFNTGTEPTVYQLWVGVPPPIDVDQYNLYFSPNGGGGFQVSVDGTGARYSQVPALSRSTVLLTAALLALLGLVALRRRSA